MRVKQSYKLTFLEYLFLVCVLVAMFIYQDLKAVINAEQESNMKKIKGYGLTAVYSTLIIGFGTAYKKLILYKVEKTNHQYQKSWDDQYIIKLFTVNFINFYFPLLLVAFYTRMYEDLFTMLFTQMACKQVGLNIVEYLKPLLTIKPKISKINADYQDVIDSYKSGFKIQDNKLKKLTKSTIVRKENAIREYQALRDYALENEDAKVIDNYMELVVQFGFIVLFSEAFPLAAVFSLFSNNIQMISQISNFSYERRFKAEISNGIGEF